MKKNPLFEPLSRRFPSNTHWVPLQEEAGWLPDLSGIPSVDGNPKGRLVFLLDDLRDPSTLGKLSEQMPVESFLAVTVRLPRWGRFAEYLRLWNGFSVSLPPLVSGGRQVVNSMAEKWGLEPVRFFRRGSRLLVLLRKPILRRVPSSVSVIVPVRNEEGNIRPLFGSLNQLKSIPNLEVVFIEGGSKDRTWERLQEHVARYRGPGVLRLLKQDGNGKAQAVQQAFLHSQGDLLIVLDGDLTVPVSELCHVYRAYCEGRGDVILGSRLVFPMEQGAMRPLNYLGNLFFAQLLSKITRTPISDALCGTKAISRVHYQEIRGWADSEKGCDPFGDFDLILGARALGLKLAEVPIRYGARTYGSTNIARIRHGLCLLSMTLRRSGSV